MLQIKYLYQNKIHACMDEDAECTKELLDEALDILIEKYGKVPVLVTRDNFDLISLCNNKGIKFILEEDVVLEELSDEKVKEAIKETKKEEDSKEEQMDNDVNELKTDVESTLKILSKDKIKEILTAKPDVAYYALNTILNGEVKRAEGLTGSSNVFSEKIQEIKDKLDSKVNKVQGKYSDLKKVMYKIGSLILQVVKVLLGICKFALDFVAISGTVVLRTGVLAAKEAKHAGKAIGRSFKFNVLGKR